MRFSTHASAPSQMTPPQMTDYLNDRFHRFRFNTHRQLALFLSFRRIEMDLVLSPYLRVLEQSIFQDYYVFNTIIYVRLGQLQPKYFVSFSIFYKIPLDLKSSKNVNFWHFLLFKKFIKWQYFYTTVITINITPIMCLAFFSINRMNCFLNSVKFFHAIFLISLWHTS